ncbi:beta-N-acetylhexosaminidase [Gammaproteobacteria bacterium]|nr:beta-N-acetylhexosaminidase [Gammaproteobacteria bacterium]MDC1007744.1 beta-N-acetylhexosaminidase [Gammaproteobacteria bacterium]
MFLDNTKTLFGRLMISIDGISLSAQDKQLIQNRHVGGLILFSRNFQSQTQILELCIDIKNIKQNIIIAVDQEGGRVQRFQGEFTKLPSMQAIGDYCLRNNSHGFAADLGWLMSSELMASGIDISFAPVLDVDRSTSSIIGNRSFSNNPQNVIDLASQFIHGMNEAGMQATGKHFPGHGGVKEDSHIAEPIDTRSYKDLIDNDLKPFIGLKDTLSAVMTAHITYPDIDQVCVSFSKIWLKNILRSKIGFDGVIFSDDLTMKGAGKINMQEKAMKAINAGCDMVLVCNDYEGANQVINYFEKENCKGVGKIGTMQKSKIIDWNELADNPRAIKIKQVIKTIEAI